MVKGMKRVCMTCGGDVTGYIEQVNWEEEGTDTTTNLTLQPCGHTVGIRWVVTQ